MAKIRTRARAVDMLGRQQIATTQNAISELFKNAHDAYARHVRIDFFEDNGPDKEGFLVVRDDGIGMSLDDFENKWLVLGTESKSRAGRTKIFRPENMEQRPITGEKGIGRLAIALLGRQVLVLTRAIREEGLHDLVLALIHWGLFEIPGLNLEDIEIPIATIEGGSLPSSLDVDKLRASLTKCVENIAVNYSNENFDLILKEISDFQPDPESLDKFFSSRDDSLSLKGKGTGTHFLIGPTNPIIELEIQAEDRNKDSSFRKQLMGFTNETFGETTATPIQTSFQRWLPGSLVGEEYLTPENFFTTEELVEKSDHYLNGNIDEYGQFQGNLRVYDEKYENIVIPWSENKGRPTICGPFRIMFGYSMGRLSESKMPPADWKQLDPKVNTLGGMYVYRDRIRILPYGDQAVDWLNIEKRRSLGAGYYFFSFRRMFGAVILTSEANSSLQEKAGREGFQQNEAYRQMREILVHLLIQLAAEFFRKGGTYTELFEKHQAENTKRSKALEKQQRSAKKKRDEFASGLKSFFHETSWGLPSSEIANLKQLTQARMEAASKLEDPDKAASALVRAEQEAINQLNILRSKYTQKKPAGMALNKDLSREWDGYLLEKARLNSEIFDPFEREIFENLGQVAEQARLYIDQRKRLEDRIKSIAQERKKQLNEVSSQANATATETRKTVFGITEKARLALDQTIKNIEADLNRTDLGVLEPDKIEEMRRKWEDQLTDIEGRHRDALMAARDMLAALSENLRSSDGEEPAQIMEALEQRMMALEEQADEDFEMVQLGLAVAIINHEFAASIRSVRQSVRELGQISQRTQALRPLYESIRVNFGHLDGHLNLFTPLQRRLYQKPQTISGKSISKYVNDLFENRLVRHKVTLEFTDSFLASQMECYPSNLYPAIINMIDNAIFWLDSIKQERIIRLDASSETLIIANNGSEIEERDWQRIFERGFSRKPGGRGLGLFISRQALKSEGMALELDTPPSGFNVAFHISVPNLKFTQ